MVGTQEEITHRIVDSVATATDTDPLDLPPLYEAIDPEVVKETIEGSDRSKVVIGYAGQGVIVHADGSVETEATTGISVA